MDFSIENKNEKQHLIKLDIDGTITGFDGFDDFETLNPKIEEVIKRITAQGHIVCLTTGRNYFGALPIYKKANLNTLLSTYNGAYIKNPNRPDSLPIVHLIANKVVKEILEEPAIKKNLLNVLLDRDDLKIICTSEEEHYHKIFYKGNPFLKGNFGEIPHLLADSDILQMVVEFPKNIEILNEVASCLRKYRDSIAFFLEKKLIKDKSKVGSASLTEQKILVPDPSKVTFRIRNKHSSKARGAELVASYYNISLENTLAFGNEVNDIEIIKSVGKGVVTSDSNSYLKMLAYDVTNHEHKINSDAVAEYLNNYFKILE